MKNLLSKTSNKSLSKLLCLVTLITASQVSGCNDHEAKNTTEVEQTHLQLNITANDKNGIIKSISEVIHSHGGNLLKLESKRETAPHTGVLMFSAELSIAIAIAEEKDKLLTGLESIADDLMVDVV